MSALALFVAVFAGGVWGGGFGWVLAGTNPMLSRDLVRLDAWTMLTGLALLIVAWVLA